MTDWIPTSKTGKIVEVLVGGAGVIVLSAVWVIVETPKELWRVLKR